MDYYSYAVNLLLAAGEGQQKPCGFPTFVPFAVAREGYRAGAVRPLGDRACGWDAMQ
jgi:hypothetical protein